MLKRVFVNNKKIPVPVPVKTLSEALLWIEQTLVPPGHQVTRVALDDRLIGEPPYSSESDDPVLVADSKLEIQIDSPIDLTVQTLEATRNLSSVILGGIKVLAVECWQAKQALKPADLESTATDLTLILDLLDHVSALIEPMQIEAGWVEGIRGMAKRALGALSLAISNSDWKACAKILLNKLEPLLKDLVAEAETLQIRIMTQGNSSKFAQTGSIK